MLIVFEAHATTLDNEAGLASGWNDVDLSEKGEQQAKELGERYKLHDFDAIFCADLQRAHRTASIAFPDISPKKLFLDWRLRECDYGEMTLKPKAEVEADKINRLARPFPKGESYADAMKRMKSFVDDLRVRSQQFQQIMVIGSRATHYGLDHWIDGKKLEDLVKEQLIWQPGWPYTLQ